MSFKEWKEYKLNDIIEIKHGYAFKGEYFSITPTKDILLTPGNFKIGGGFKSDKFKYYNGGIPINYVLKENDILVSMTDLSKEGDTLGFSLKVPSHQGIQYLHNQRLGLLQFKNNDLDKNFIYWLLRTTPYQLFVRNSATGTTVRHTSPTRIKEYEFLAPNINIQRQIAFILSSLDDKIELNRQTNKTLEAIAQTLFNEMCVPKIDILEEGWSLIKLADIADVTSSKRIFREEYILSGIPFYRGKEITQLSKGANISTELFISEERYNKIKKSFGIPKIGDLLITSVGTIGSVWLVDDDSPFYFKDGNVTWVKNYNSEIDGDYIFQWLKTKSAIDQIKSVTIGSTQEALTISALKGLKIIIPDKVIISKVIVQLKAINSMRVLNVEETQTLIKLRDSLLPKLMKGEITLSKNQL